jgi:1-acyl-sn-glycerol-3-phosphate acyltransferase
MLRLLGHVVHGLWQLHTSFPRATPEVQTDMVRQWSRRMLDSLGIALQAQPAPQWPAHQGVLVVINHISWLDILVLNAVHPMQFVAKDDIQRWPLIGRLVAASGTLFIRRRSARDALRVVHTMAQALRAGARVAVFPEGTTSSGEAVLPFHGNLLQAALDAQVAVMPVGLGYWQLDGHRRSAAVRYIDDDTLLGSIWRTLRHGPVLARVVFGPPQTANGQTRRQWAYALQVQVQQFIQLGV